MKSLELLEELNKILIDSTKKTEIASQMVVVQINGKKISVNDIMKSGK